MVSTLETREQERMLKVVLSGDRRRSADLALEMIAAGMSPTRFLVDVLRPVQTEVGWRWQLNELTVDQEHAATNAADYALSAVVLAGEAAPNGRTATVVCATGDLHWMPAKMAADLLTLHGWSVTFLGAVTEPAHLRRHLSTASPDLVTVTCSLALYYRGARDLVQVALDADVPVALGGAALAERHRCAALGANRFGDPDLAEFTASGPLGDEFPAKPNLAEADAILDRAIDLAVATLDRMAVSSPGVADHDETRRAAALENLEKTFGHVAGALMVGDQHVFDEYGTWLRMVMTSRGAAPDSIVRTIRACAETLVDHGFGEAAGVASATVDLLIETAS